MRTLRCFLVVLSTVFAYGCATPDIKPWAESTVALSGAVKKESSAVAARMTTAEAKIKAWNPEDRRVKTLKDSTDNYVADTRRIEDVLDLAVSYSEALTDLAAAGEDGEKAANTIIDSFKRFTSLAGIAVPGAGAGAAIAGNVLRSVSAAVTRIQAQKTLAVAMDAAENGDPAAGIPGPIPAIADGIATMFAKNGPQRKIVSGFRGVEDGIDLDIAGFNQVAFYRGLAVQKVEIGGTTETLLDHLYGGVSERLITLEDLAGKCVKARHPNDPTIERQYCLPRQPESVAALVTLVKEAREKSDQFMAAQMSNAKFAEQRARAADEIVNAVKAWHDGHGKIAEALRDCGGLRALRKTCGNLTFGNFKAAVEKLKAVAGKGDE